MFAIRMLWLSVLGALLVACSSGPSDGDLKEVARQQMAQLDLALKPLGLPFDDAFALDVKMLNKADKGNNQWQVDMEMTLTAKRSLREFTGDQRLMLGMQFGEFEKGKVILNAKDSILMTKGDKGWMTAK